jgi:hypothetical protein
MAALAGILNKYHSNIRSAVCDAAKDTIKDFWDTTVDGFTCSQFCPCPDASLSSGGYDNVEEGTFTAFGIYDGNPYGRSGNQNGGVPSAAAESNPIVSVSASDARASDSDVDASSYSTELKSFLSDNSLLKPKTASKFKDCFDKVLGNDAFGEGNAEEINEFINTVWDFLTELESKYDCGGFCYTPLFGLTSDVALGRPSKDCFQSILDVTVGRAGAVSAASAVFMFLTLFISLSLCGGNPQTPGEETDPVEKLS